MEGISENIEFAVLNLESICRICWKEPENPINLSNYNVQLSEITQLEVSFESFYKMFHVTISNFCSRSV